MTKKRSKKTVVPKSPEQGAVLLMAAAVPVFDPHDGYGADWKLIAQSMIYAAQTIIKDLPEDERQLLAAQIHQQIYDRFLAVPDINKDLEELDIDETPTIDEKIFDAAPKPGPKFNGG